MFRHALIAGSVALLALLLFGAIKTAPAQDDPPRRPRILVTNDDGIESPGLRVLVKELAEFADVSVCAPATNRSGASQSVTYISTPMLREDVDIDGASRAIALDATPADAAHFGIVHLGKDQSFDLLISGMNRGSNVGMLSHLSGTVGAAMQGAFCEVPSIAISTDARLQDLAAAAAFTRRFAQQCLERGADPDVVYSLNFPRQRDGRWNGVRVAPMGGSYIQSASYRQGEVTDKGTMYRAEVTIERDGPAGCDTQVYMDGYITITPLRFDWTHREALVDLADWKFEDK